MSSFDSSDSDQHSDGPSSPKRYNLEIYQKHDREEIIRKTGNPSRVTDWRKDKKKEAAKSTLAVLEQEQSDDSVSSRESAQLQIDAGHSHEGISDLPPSVQSSDSRGVNSEEIHHQTFDNSSSSQESVSRELDENCTHSCVTCPMGVDGAIADGKSSDDDNSLLYSSISSDEEMSNADSTNNQSHRSSSRSSDVFDTDALSDTSDNVDFRQFEDKVGGDDMYHRIMFEKSAITVGDVILMIKACSVRFGLSRQGQLAWGNMMKLCAGPEFEDLSLSEYFMDKYVPTNNDQLDYHYYCTTCCRTVVYSTNAQEKIPNQTFRCPNTSCQSPNLVSVKSQNYFTSVSMEYQIKRIFSNEILLKDIIKNIESRKNPSQIDGSSFKDVHDGSLNKQMMIKHRDESTIVLSGAVNVDGAPFNQNGKMHGWPSQMLLNDLSPKLRWKYVILTGMLMTVTKEPGIDLLNLYMEKTLLDQFKKLNGKRITVTVNGRSFTFCFKILNINLDTPARAMLQNRMLFSAAYGCSWCYQKGTYLLGSIRFPSSHASMLRTRESHLRDVRELEEILRSKPKLRSLKKKKHVRGVKGPCFIMCEEYEDECEHLDPVWTFTYEYMHGMTIGVSQYIVQVLRDTDCPVRLKPSDWSEVESRLLKIKPTQDIHRLPREGLLTSSAKMKASEARSWILCYSLPCLKGILDETALNHYSLLTKTLYSYLKEEISSEEVDEGEEDSIKFIKDYEIIYKRSPTFNIHSWKHAAESIRRSGPPALNSTFPSESNIYFLKLLVSGPKDMNKQISKKYLQLMYFRTGCTQHPNMSEGAREFCENLFVHKPAKTATRDDNCGVVYFQNIGEEDVQGFGHCTIYSKCIYKDMVFHSIRYTLVEKTDDTFVQLSSGEYARIIDIISCARSCFLSLSYVQIEEQLPFEHVSHIRKVIGWDESRTLLRSIQLVERKIVFIDVGVAQYVCKLPNRIEIQ